MAYDAMHGRAKAYGELIDLIDGAEGRIEGLRKRLESGVKANGI